MIWNNLQQNACPIHFAREVKERLDLKFGQKGKWSSLMAPNESRVRLGQLAYANPLYNNKAEEL